MLLARRILLCLRWGIGDVVMELPMLRNLRQRLPHAHITALGAWPATELLEGAGLVDRLVDVRRFGLRHWGDAGAAEARRQIAAWCRTEGFECVLEGSHAPVGARLGLASVGLPWLDSGDHVAAGIRENMPGQTGAGRWMMAAAMGAAWGIPASAEPATLALRDDERAAAARTTRRLAGGAPVVGLAPTASSPLKRGAASEFARVADALVERFGCQLLLFGGTEDPRGCAVVASMTNHRHLRVIEPVHLRFTAAMLERCDVLVCNDSGLMHLAAAVGAGVVAVFACSLPSLYLPRGGVAVQRWRQPCSHLDASSTGFGVTPCVRDGACLDPDHERIETWSGAAIEAASDMLAGKVTGSKTRR